MMITHTYHARDYVFDTSTIHYGRLTHRATRPLILIHASSAEVWEDGEFQCTYDSAIVQSCPQLLTYIHEHYPEYFI